MNAAYEELRYLPPLNFVHYFERRGSSWRWRTRNKWSTL